MTEPTDDHMEIDSGMYICLAPLALITPDHLLTLQDPELPSTSKTDADAVAPGTKPKTLKNKFELKKWTAVAFWSWGMYFEC